MSSDTPANTNGDHISKKSKKRARETLQEQLPLKKHKKSSNPPILQNAASIASSIDESAMKLQQKQEKSKEKKKKKHAQHIQPTDTTDARSNSLTLNDKHLERFSPFVHETQSLFLGLSPVSHRFPLEGACAEFISPLLLTYYPPLNGVVLSYSNPRLSQQPQHDQEDTNKVMGRSIDEYGVTYIWLTADFLIFRPEIGTVLEGHVNLQNESILGLLCYNYFNAGVERSRLPKDWKWIETDEGEDEEEFKNSKGTQGFYVDAQGKRVEGRMLFKVKDYEASISADGGSGSINIYGTLLPADEDAALDTELRQAPVRIS